MKKTLYKEIQIILFSAIAVLSIVLLLYLWITPNVSVSQTRELTGYEKVEDAVYEKIEDPASPIGTVREFRFQLTDEIQQDTTLMFKFSHQYADVYLGEENVYSLRMSEELSMIRTPGTNWAMIPLYREDAGKEVRVVLMPVYEQYQDQKTEFLIGSKLALYRDQLKKSALEIALSLINVLVGLLLLGVAVYFSRKKLENGGFYALAILAVVLGLWNFTQTDFAPFILREKGTFVYYVSLVLLMICVLPLIKSVRRPKKNPFSDLLENWCILCGVLGIIQLVLQLCGVYDMREMLKITHGMIIVSSLVLIANGVMFGLRPLKEGEQSGRLKGVWMLGVGALLDMIFYYARNTSSGLLFVLLSIFIYVLIEGIRMFFDYTSQKQKLEEKETQLTLSRITTMMSQIRSHFVFNILNAISGMCKYDPEKADETIVRFARYLRRNIDIMEDDRPNLFQTELEHLEDYVVLEQVRFGDKIEFYSDVKVDQFRIPPLILQPIVENAIKHGLTKKPNGGIVILRTWEEDGNIKISVEDDGVGFEPSELEKKSSIGLKNIRYRLYHLMHGTMEIESHTGVGTTVTLTIPKGEAE